MRFIIDNFDTYDDYIRFLSMLREKRAEQRTKPPGKEIKKGKA